MLWADSTSWDVPELAKSGKATWPEHTQKYLLDEEGTWTQPPEPEWNGGWDRFLSDSMLEGRKMAGLDYVKTRTQALEAAKRHSLGWETKLELDEFPLEIQCQSCFW